MTVESSTEWVVLLEAADRSGQEPIERSDFDRLLEAWAAATPSTLYSPSRYALQISIQAATPPLALSSALRLWKDSLQRAGLPDWWLVRAELVTPEELERELQAAELLPLGAAACPERPARTPDAVEDEILRRALQDELTGLISREMLLDALRLALSVGSPTKTHGVLVLDVDGFRPLPLALGPGAGDEVLVEIARRLTGAVRRADSVARIGVDEFAVLVEVRSLDELDIVADRILDGVSQPLASGMAMVVAASIGVATTSDRDDADIVLHEAEDAVGRVKAGGGGHRRVGAGRDEDGAGLGRRRTPPPVSSTPTAPT